MGDGKHLPSRPDVPKTRSVEQRTEEILHNIVTVDQERHNLQRVLVKDARRWSERLLIEAIIL